MYIPTSPASDFAESAWVVEDFSAVLDDMKALKRALGPFNGEEEPLVTEEDFAELIDRAPDDGIGWPDSGRRSGTWAGLLAPCSQSLRAVLHHRVAQIENAIRGAARMTPHEISSPRSALLPLLTRDRLERAFGMGDLPIVWVFRADLLQFAGAKKKKAPRKR